MALKFDSDEYWQHKTWDRFRELELVKPQVYREFKIQEQATVNQVVTTSNPNSPLRIMDLACGTGKITDSILRALQGKAHITLVDFNLKTLQEARIYLNGIPNIDFLHANAYNINQEFFEEFDVVVCMDFLHHISKLDFLLDSVSQTLKPNGVFIGNIFAQETYKEWDRIKYGYLKSSFRQLSNYLSKNIYDVDLTEVKKIIRLSGFSRIEGLSKSKLHRYLSTYFKDIKIATTYYYWFSAVKK